MLFRTLSEKTRWITVAVVVALLERVKTRQEEIDTLRESIQSLEEQISSLEAEYKKSGDGTRTKINEMVSLFRFRLHEVLSFQKIALCFSLFRILFLLDRFPASAEIAPTNMESSKYNTIKN